MAETQMAAAVRRHGRMDAFPTTHWSLVLRAGRTDAPKAAPALQRLCQSYWYPLYAFVRRRGYAQHDAEDITQGFFEHLLKNDVFTKVDCERGRFRSFLLAAAANFLLNERDKRCAKKRGGAVEIYSWDSLQAAERFSAEPRSEATPETLFERRWAFTVLDAVLQRLKAEHFAADRAGVYEALSPYLTVQMERGVLSTLAEKLGMNEGAVKTALHRLRRRFGELLRKEVAYTVGAPEDVDDELRYLLGVIAG